MKIQSLRINNFRGLSDVTINNFDPHLNLFIGVNGAGKSSVLDAIVLLLTSFTARLSTSNSKGMPIPTNDIRKDAREGCSLNITMDNGFGWTKHRTRKMEKKEVSDYDQLNILTKDLRMQLDDQQPICLPMIVHYGVKRSITDIPLKFTNASEPNPSSAYKDWVDSKASYRDIFPWLRNEEDYENEMIRDNPNARDRGLEALREAMRRIFPEYTDLRVRRKPHQEVVLKKNGEELPLSQLSDGEKCYIAFVCDIVRRLSLANPVGNVLDGEGIVLIDEIDLHLHPSWEQTAMAKLHETFKNIQFIVTAHSPLVASHFDGQVFAVKDGNVIVLPRLTGLDYSTILQDWMDTTDDNREISSLVELFKAYSDNGMEAQANAVKLKLLNLLHGDANAEIMRRL